MAGIPSHEFSYSAARQRSQNWCWAATIQMVLNYHGLYVSQEQVVARIFGGRLPDAPGSPTQIMQALSGWAPDARGRYSGITATTFIPDPATIVRDLQRRWPLIVGLRGETIGHAYVLTAVQYEQDPYSGRVYPTHAVLRDPWPASPSRQVIPWETFERRVQFAARVRVVRY